MRVVFYAKRHKRSGITLHMERALRQLGHEVLRFNPHKTERMVGKKLAWWHILRKTRAFKPDVAVVFTFDLSPEQIAELGQFTRTCTFFDDCPPELSQRVRDAAQASHVFFITNRGQIPLYEEQLGITPAYVTGGCDPTDHVRVDPDPEWASEVAFIGQADLRGGRVDVMQALSKEFDTKVYGKKWPEVAGLEPAARDVYPPQYRAICNSAKVIIGNDLRQDVDLYFSNRTWISLGCGAFLLTRYVPNLEEILKEDEHCAFFRSTEHAVEQVRRYLADDALRQRVAAQGHAYAHAEYSYAKMLERMLAHPGLQPGA